MLDTDPDPVAAWRPQGAGHPPAADALGERRPLLSALVPRAGPARGASTRLAACLVETVCNRYWPSVPEFLRHVEELRGRCGWDGSFSRHRVVAAVGRRRRIRGRRPWPVPPRADRDRPSVLGVPSELADDARTVHAYEPHDYADRVAVVGAGMAAATEWLNALETERRSRSVRRREPARRPLNVPRPFSRAEGLAASTPPGAWSVRRSSPALAKLRTRPAGSGTSPRARAA